MSRIVIGIEKWLHDIKGMEAEGQRQAEAMIGEIRGFAIPALKSLQVPDDVLQALLPLLQRAWRSGFTDGSLYVMESFKKNVGPAMESAEG